MKTDLQKIQEAVAGAQERYDRAQAEGVENDAGILAHADSVGDVPILLDAIDTLRREILELRGRAQVLALADQLRSTAAHLNTLVEDVYNDPTPEASEAVQNLLVTLGATGWTSN